jgi:hypothetical protein
VFKSLPGLLSPPQTIISVPVHTTVCASRPTGAAVTLVATQLLVIGLYLPPVLRDTQEGLQEVPPQTIISLPVHTALCASRAEGALIVLVAVQPLMPGSYVPPVLKRGLKKSRPPHTIISLPVHTAVCPPRRSGGLAMLVAAQLFAPGLYLPPVLRETQEGLQGGPIPPQMIISLPVHTAV